MKMNMFLMMIKKTKNCKVELEAKRLRVEAAEKEEVPSRVGKAVERCFTSVSSRVFLVARPVFASAERGGREMSSFNVKTALLQAMEKMFGMLGHTIRVDVLMCTPKQFVVSCETPAQAVVWTSLACISAIGTQPCSVLVVKCVGTLLELNLTVEDAKTSSK